MNSIKISAIIVTLNEERNIASCLQSLQDVADEIIVVDSGSTDETEEICKRFGVKFVFQKWLGYGRQKNFAISQTSHDWVLSIDADEELTSELVYEIKQIFAQNTIPFTAYEIPRSLIFLGRKFKYGNESCQLHLRLFNKTTGQFANDAVHEKVQVEGKIGTLKADFLHYTYRNIEHHLHKLNTYTSIAAKADVDKGRKVYKWKVGFDLMIRFFIAYIIRRNILNGYEGFVWSVLSAHYKFVRSCKLLELGK